MKVLQNIERSELLMGYYIRGFVLPKLESKIIDLDKEKTPYSTLNQGTVLIPLTDELYDHINKLQGKEAPGYSFLTDKLIEFGLYLSRSRNSTVLYIEADYFGGHGSQSAIAWNNGVKIFEELNGKESINKALRIMGIRTDWNKDEFETIGLNKNRRLEDWLES